MKPRGCLFRAAQGVFVATVLLAVLVFAYWLFPFWGIPFNYTRHTTIPLTPPWALECWLWEDDVNTADEVRRLLAGYEQYDFPVRTILIDSPWTTRYNDFTVDEARYPNPTQFFGELQDEGYRVVLWMTCNVNSENKDTAIEDARDWFEEAKANGYLAGNGIELGWWKGRGGYIDYTNPDAMAWWRGLQQDVFDWGIDGWKLDGSATLFRSQFGPIPVPYQTSHGGPITTRGYMDRYYRDEYAHGLTQNPEFITLARSMDRNAHPEGFAPIDAAPVTWVGDQDHTWTLEEEGIEEALTDILRAADLGYGVIGSDVAGYSGGEIPPELYIRWAQFSAFCGLFLNGGHDNRAMWERTPEELEIVREYAWRHTELVPYIYSHLVAQHEGGPGLMRPLDGTYQYLFGDAFFVAPIYEPGNTRTVQLPGGDWRYFFDDAEAHTGPKTITRDYPLDEFPVYVRDGAIIPMRVSRGYTGFGDATTAGYVTVLVYPAESSATVYVDPDTQAKTRITVTKAEIIRVAIEDAVPAHRLLIRSEARPSGVTWNGTRAGDWTYDEAKGLLIIQSGARDPGVYAIE